jgi:hypothetical protein
MVFQDYSWPDKHAPSGNQPLSHNCFTFSTYASGSPLRLRPLCVMRRTLPKTAFSGQGRSCRPKSQPMLAKLLGSRPSRKYLLLS